MIGGALLLAAFAGCRARVSAVSPDSVDKAPPYSFPNLTTPPLASIAFAADDLHGWAVGTDTLLGTIDGGSTWYRAKGLPRNFDLNCVSVSPDGVHGLAVGALGIAIRTDDGGKFWNKVTNLPTTNALRSVALSADGQKCWIVGEQGLVLRSLDAGHTWKKLDIFLIANLQAVAFSSDSQHGWVAGDEGTLLVTVDGGATWKDAEGISQYEYLQSITFSPDNLHGWAVGDGGASFRSVDGGRSWLKLPQVPTRGYLNSVAFASDRLRGLAVGDGGTILRSGDGGQTWNRVGDIPTMEDIYSVTFSADGNRGCAVGDYGSILQSSDGGRTWRRVAGPVTEDALLSIAFAADALRGWAVGMSNLESIQISSDGGQTWHTVGSPKFIWKRSLAFAPDGKHGWVVGGKMEPKATPGGNLNWQATVFLSGDGGQTWQNVGDIPDAKPLRSVAFAADGQRGWAVGESGTMLSSRDGGQTWQKHPGVLTGAQLNCVTLMPDGMRGWVVGAAGTILRTSNGGQSWEKVPGIVTQRGLNCVTFEPDGVHGWAAGDSNTVLRSTDGGQSWETMLGEGTTINANSIAFAADGLRGWLVGDEGYVARSVDGGVYWWYVAHVPKEGPLYSVVTSADGEHVWAAGDHGTILRTSSAVENSNPFEGKLSVHLENSGSTIRPVLSIDGRTSPTANLGVHLDLAGPRATGDLAKGFVRNFAFGSPYEGWKKAELGPGVYTCHVEVFDGWNVVSQDIAFGNGPLERIVGFMGWDIAASQPLEFFKAHGTQNLVLLLILYCLAIAGLFVFMPSWFVLWHEKAAPLIAALPIPSKATDKVTQLAGLFLITRGRALDAVVAEFAPLALAEMEKLPEVAARPKWVAAPLQVEDELFGRTASPFPESAAAAEGELYVRGLTELKRHLVHRRWWVSIEGPGGVGKSALAFQMARWFAAPEPESRLHIVQAIPISIRSLKDGLDAEILAELKRILDLPRLSPQLSGALLSRRRVLALVDGISEKTSDIEALELGPLNPSKGAALTHLVVMTSRRRIQIPDVVKVLPKAVDLGTIDEVLSRYLDDVVGAGRFSPSQREAIRESLKGIMKEMSSESGQPPQIPMVFVKLIIQRADQVLAKDDASEAAGGAEASLPKDLSELVDAYVASLLEARPDGVAQAGQTRRAALACIGQDGLPKLRPLAAYEARSLSLAELEGLVITGLMVKDAADVGDPRYKFALDPIAEYLAAKELVISVRDGRMTPDQLKGDCAQFVAVSDVAAKIALIARALGVAVS
jgi:photosystem II stability/assembly factor-like uncharacterized protein